MCYTFANVQAMRREKESFCTFGPILGKKCLPLTVSAPIVLSAQIALKDYSFYILHPILNKLGMYHHWANALHICVRI